MLCDHHVSSGYCLFTRSLSQAMAILEILEFPDPRLRTVAIPVAVVDDRIRQLVDNMFETMYDAPAIGLAASQVYVHERVIDIDINEDRCRPLVAIDPHIAELQEYDEGCLSIPGFYETVVRPGHVRVSALDRDGNPFTIEPEGLLAVCIQHEIDHLNGKLFVDYVSPIKRSRIRKKLEKKHRAQA